jgi:hypothetical protein
MNKLESIASENDFVEILGERGNFCAIIRNPETGQIVDRLYAATETGIRAQIIKFVYSTMPMGYEKY